LSLLHSSCPSYLRPWESSRVVGGRSAAVESLRHLPRPHVAIRMHLCQSVAVFRWRSHCSSRRSSEFAPVVERIVRLLAAGVAAAALVRPPHLSALLLSRNLCSAQFEQKLRYFFMHSSRSPAYHPRSLRVCSSSSVHVRGASGDPQPVCWH